MTKSRVPLPTKKSSTSKCRDVRQRTGWRSRSWNAVPGTECHLDFCFAIAIAAMV